MDDIEIRGREQVVFHADTGRIVVSIRRGRLRITGDWRLVLSPEASNLVFVWQTSDAENAGAKGGGRK